MEAAAAAAAAPSPRQAEGKITSWALRRSAAGNFRGAAAAARNPAEGEATVASTGTATRDSTGRKVAARAGTGATTRGCNVVARLKARAVRETRARCTLALKTRALAARAAAGALVFTMGAATTVSSLLATRATEQ